MIKNIISVIVIIALCAFIGIGAFNGINITDDFNIISYKQLQQTVKDYEQKLVDYDKLVNVDYQNKLGDLSTAQKGFDEAKKSYEELKNYNSYEELLELTRDKQYPIEFLWIKLELIARNNNLGYNFKVVDNKNEGNKNIEVTLQGEYLGVKNYIYDMLIDLELQFKAEELKIVPNGTQVLATFNIKSINVVM